MSYNSTQASRRCFQGEGCNFIGCVWPSIKSQESSIGGYRPSMYRRSRQHDAKNQCRAWVLYGSIIQGVIQQEGVKAFHEHPGLSLILLNLRRGLQANTCCPHFSFWRFQSSNPCRCPIYLFVIQIQRSEWRGFKLTKESKRIFQLDISQ